MSDLYERVLDGDPRALARAITVIENRSPGYRELVSALYEHTGDAEIIGITGSPGSGKSTLVDKLAAEYRERDLTVGVIAVDPSSPYSGGAVLGDRIRMGMTATDMDVFFRSMSARGSLGGLSAATGDAVKALDAFGKDRIIIETVGAGQNEIDVVRTADTVAVLVPPASGDAVQTLKAGILEIGDVFVVNKADLEGADRTVQELREMINLRDGPAGPPGHSSGHHGAGSGRQGRGGSTGGGGRGGSHGGGHGSGHGAAGQHDDAEQGDDAREWTPQVVETVATKGEGVEDLIGVFEDHHEHLVETGRLDEQVRARLAEEIRTLLREDVGGLLEEELDRRGGIDELVEAVLADETDPYRIADDVIGPIAECLEQSRR